MNGQWLRQASLTSRLLCDSRGISEVKSKIVKLDKLIEKMLSVEGKRTDHLILYQFNQFVTPCDL